MKILLFIFLLSCFSCNNNTSTSSHKIDTAAFAAQCREEAKPAFMAASKAIDDVKSEYAVGNKRGCVILYNATLAIDMGEMDDADDIKAKLDTVAHNYIMFKWYQAAASIAKQHAAESKFNSEQIKAESSKKAMKN